MLYFPRWKTVLITLMCLAGLAFAAPNLLTGDQLKNVPSWLPHQRVHLGLDLRGGSHLLLKVSTDEIVKETLESVRDDARSRLRKAKIGYTGLNVQKNIVRVRVRKTEDLDRAYAVLRKIIQPLAGSVFTGAGGADLEVAKDASGAITLTPTTPALTERINSAMAAAMETIRRRVDEMGTTEPNIQRQGVDRILVQVPGLDDPQQLKNIIGKTAKLSFHSVHATITASEAKATTRPPGFDIYPSKDGFAREYLLNKRAVVSGEDLVDSQPGFDQRTNEPIVSFRFNSKGSRRFGKWTQNNVGRPFAIVLDKEVISAPVVREAILGGTGQISGSFTVEGANNLAILLRSGALPATITVVEERTVGASLGADSVTAGAMAALIGLGAVIVFMIVAYGSFGLFSTAALLINLSLIIGVLSIIQATLTLPGIAGIVLTIGMAVDANVLIFERIREELRAGKSSINAIETGYKRALGTILDANITTFIAAFILFIMGSGPVRGFAVTLSIGIIMSVFTAFTVTRLMISWWLSGKKRGAVELPI